MELLYGFIGLLALVVFVLIVVLWRHKWRWRETRNETGKIIDSGAKADLMNGDLVKDVERVERENILLAERAEEIGRKSVVKEKE